MILFCWVLAALASPSWQPPVCQADGAGSVADRECQPFDAAHWAPNAVRAVLGQSPLAAVLASKFECMPLLTTDYSGYGCCEIAMGALVDALQRQGQRAECLIWRSSDISRSRRKMLCAGNERYSALHVFGDILKRCSPKTRRLMAEAHRTCQTRLQRGRATPSEVEAAGGCLLRRLHRILRGETFSALAKQW